MEFLKGYRTYTGLAVALFGVLGLTQYITTEELDKVLRLIFEVAGILFAAYGRYQATK